MDVTENNDEPVEHEHCLGSHECHGGHGEVLDEQGADGAAHFSLGPINSNEEEEVHTEDGNAQLYVKFA